MSDLKLIADAFKANFDPRLEAEAAQFRTNRDIADLKLAQAKREAERDRELDPYRRSWRELFSGGGQVPDTEYDPYHGENKGQWPVDTVARGKPVMSWNGDRGVFEFDQSRIGDIIANGTALYGPDFTTKWHEFLTKAAPTYPGLENSEVNVAQRKGLEAIPGGVKLSDVSANNARKSALAQADIKSEIDTTYGSWKDDAGVWHYGEGSPQTKMIRKENANQSDGGKGSGATIPEIISGSEGPAPSPEPSSSPSVDSDEGVEPEEGQGLTTDPIDDFAKVLTTAKRNAATAQNAAIREQISKAKPSGRYVDMPGVGMRWVPDEPKAPTVVDDVEKRTVSENNAVANFMLKMSKANDTEAAADQTWLKNVRDNVNGMIMNNGETLDDDHKSQVVLEMDDVRQRLVKEGYSHAQARKMAENIVITSWLGRFRVNPQIIGKKVSLADDIIEFGGGGTFGQPMTMEQKLEQDPKDREPEDTHRGYLSAIFGGANRVNPDQVRTDPVFRASIDSHLGKLPNVFTKKDEYLKQGQDWLLSTYGIDFDSLVGLAQGNEALARNKLISLMFLEDIKKNGTSTGYVKELPNKQGIVRVTVNQQDIDNVIVPQIEKIKAELLGY